MITELLFVISLVDELKIHCPEPVLQQQATIALDRWSAALDNSLKYSFVPDSSQASVRIAYGAWHPSAFAETFKQGDPVTGRLISAFVIFKDDIPDPQLQQAVMVHEIGHVLGLHHDESLGEKPYDGPSMAPYGDRAQSTLHYLDVLRIRELYGLSPINNWMDVIVFRKGRQIVWQPVQGDSYTQLTIDGKFSYKLPKKKAYTIFQGNGYSLELINFKLIRLRRGETVRVSQHPKYGVPYWIVQRVSNEKTSQKEAFIRRLPDTVQPTILFESVPEF